MRQAIEGSNRWCVIVGRNTVRMNSDGSVSVCSFAVEAQAVHWLLQISRMTVRVLECEMPLKRSQDNDLLITLAW